LGIKGTIIFYEIGGGRNLKRVHAKRYGFKEGQPKTMAFMERALIINIKYTDSIHNGFIIFYQKA